MRSIYAIYALGMIAALSGGVVSPARADDNNIAQLLNKDGQTVSDDFLAQQRGGTAQQIGNVSDNLTIGRTGDNNFGSMGSSQGMITVFQNTGNNVVMQSQMNLNVDLH